MSIGFYPRQLEITHVNWKLPESIGFYPRQLKITRVNWQFPQ